MREEPLAAEGGAGDRAGAARAWLRSSSRPSISVGLLPARQAARSAPCGPIAGPRRWVRWVNHEVAAHDHCPGRRGRGPGSTVPWRQWGVAAVAPVEGPQRRVAASARSGWRQHRQPVAVRVVVPGLPGAAGAAKWRIWCRAPTRLWHCVSLAQHPPWCSCSAGAGDADQLLSRQGNREGGATSFLPGSRYHRAGEAHVRCRIKPTQPWSLWPGVAAVAKIRI
jgi:hypothetical protein